MILIGLTGYARVGKDTVADYLVSEYGFTKLSMAAPLKRMLRTLDPWIAQPGGREPIRVSELWEALDGDENAIKSSGYGLEYRRLLQQLGTDCIRAIDEDFWVKAMVQEIEESGADRAVIPDIRFPNEGELIWNPQRFSLRKVDARSALFQVDRFGVHYDPDGHESERWVGKMGENGVIINSGHELEYLHEAVDEVLHRYEVLA